MLNSMAGLHNGDEEQTIPRKWVKALIREREGENGWKRERQREKKKKKMKMKISMKCQWINNLKPYSLHIIQYNLSSKIKENFKTNSLPNLFSLSLSFSLFLSLYLLSPYSELLAPLNQCTQRKLHGALTIE